jgi:hypothetical protein
MAGYGPLSVKDEVKFIPGANGLLYFPEGYYIFFLSVLMPNGQYKGQKLIRLVRIRTTDKLSNKTAHIPEITCKKKRTITIRDKSTLMTLSTLPTFFFILIKC